MKALDPRQRAQQAIKEIAGASEEDRDRDLTELLTHTYPTIEVQNS